MSINRSLSQEKTWKYFDQNPITHSTVHYLLTIYDLLNNKGYARLTDVAKKLNITPGSCSISLKSLTKKGLVKKDENRFLRLTTKGNKFVAIVKTSRKLLLTFFIDTLQVSKKQAGIDACKIEHLLSSETLVHLDDFINSIKNDS